MLDIDKCQYVFQNYLLMKKSIKLKKIQNPDYTYNLFLGFLFLKGVTLVKTG